MHEKLFKTLPLAFFLQLSLGVAMLISSFWSSFEGLFAFAVIFGVLSNGYGFIKASAATLLGAKHFADAFSWMFLFEGIGLMAGPSLAGICLNFTYHAKFFC